MKTITTKVSGKSAGAFDGDGNSVSFPWGSMSFDDAHKQAAIRLCDKMGWSGVMIGGHLLKSGQNAGMVWVFVDDRSPLTASGSLVFLDGREFGAVLAGLRLYQSALDGIPFAIDGVESIASNCGQFEPLNSFEVGALADWLNIGE